MAPCKLLAFLLCAKATRSSDDKINLQGIFDRLVIADPLAVPQLFFAYYKVAADQPCTIRLRIVGPSGNEITGQWRDTITEPGLAQSAWSLTTSLFSQPGHYNLELREESAGRGEVSLATFQLAVDSS